MVHRHFLNDPRTLVDDALRGLSLASPELVRWNADPSFVVRRTRAENKVAMVSGGGSGHEPLHPGFVGVGMLDAAVPGAVFASPSARQVEEATHAAHSGAGVLFIVKNYTGDIINFGLAADALEDDGISVRTVVVDDDLATSGMDGGPGRRGTGAVVLVEKLCGAAAEDGASLDEVAELGRRIVANSRSLSIGLSAGTHPGDSKPSFELSDGEIAYGIGIHGEQGIGTRPFGTARELAPLLVEPLIEDLNLGAGDSVIAFVNGLGSTHALELYTVFAEVSDLLKARDIEIRRSLVGSYVTSLDMSGCSLTITRCDDEIARLWDAPVRTIGMTW